jgi:hypothetical protein
MEKGIVSPQSPAPGVGEDMRQFTGLYGGLGFLPETGIQQIGVVV